MPKLIVDGREVHAPEGSTVLAALMNAGTVHLRRSVKGEPRAALCGMGICFECRVVIQGVPQKSCQVLCEDGMEVRLGG